ncbi:Acyl-CoA thioesterase 8 [Lunasporangiospora selenospora]|uniref:Acyl-CoA thioesterase 8 n=1 Tax=Lunasporangiospora selenospora TaxID=979761 RepID=A0A9P6FZ79_9FUNG|nr:Acyl-CoA thioesterase 8 [Lunasporangiospora selenospora]
MSSVRAPGGNIVGQALAAAIRTVPAEFLAHSLHSNFIKTAESLKPITYEVERAHDGKSYCLRIVRAKQEESNIFICTVSFQVPRSDAPSHFFPMPEVPHHEGLASQDDFVKSLINDPNIPAPPLVMDFKDVRPLTTKDLIQTDPRTQQMFWIRCKDKLDDTLGMQQCAVAYGSDHNLLNTALLAHGASWFETFTSKTTIFIMASLDHSMWFHCPFRADEWMLYVCEAPRTGSDRALVTGKIYKEDGTLAVTVVQEGAFRFQHNL